MPRMFVLKPVVVLGCWCCMLVGSAANATDFFSTLDGNQDGVLSGREAKALLTIDADGDGEISRPEFQAAVRRHSAAVESYHRSIFNSPMFS